MMASDTYLSLYFLILGILSEKKKTSIYLTQYSFSSFEVEKIGEGVGRG